MISIEKKTIFIHIPRTAGTYIETLIEDDSSICKRNEWGLFNAPLNHLTLSQLIEGAFVPETKFQSYFTFTFIRNSWDRVISECFCPHVEALFINCRTIDERIEVVCGLAETGCRGHFLKQTAFIDHPCVHLDFIGRYDQLLLDWGYVQNNIKNFHKDLTIKKDSVRPHYREYFSTYTRELVEITYAEEIERFNFSF